MARKVKKPTDQVVDVIKDVSEAIDPDKVEEKAYKKLTEAGVRPFEHTRTAHTQNRFRLFQSPDLGSNFVTFGNKHVFTVYAATFRDRLKKTIFYKIVEGDMAGWYIDKDDLFGA